MRPTRTGGYIPLSTYLEKVSFPHSINGGAKRFELSSGESVNQIEGDTFQVVQSGQVIYRKVR